MRNSKQAWLLSPPHMSWRGRPNEVTASLIIAALPAREKTRVEMKVVSVPEPLRPGRGIMICLGWLRLFQTIVSKDYKPRAKTFTGGGMIHKAS